MDVSQHIVVLFLGAPNQRMNVLILVMLFTDTRTDVHAHTYKIYYTHTIIKDTKDILHERAVMHLSGPAWC